LQTTQIFVGRSDFLRIFGMGQPCGGGRFRSAVRPSPAAPAARAGPEHVSGTSRRQVPAAPGVCGLRRAPCPKAGSAAAC